MPLLGSVGRCTRAGTIALAVSLGATAALAVTEPPRNKPLLVEAQSHLEAGQGEKAVELLKKALTENPKDADARYMLGRLYLMTQQGAPAEKEFRAAQSYGMNTPDVANQIGEALLLQRKYKEVLDQVQPTGVDPEHRAAAMALRGRAYLGMERLDEAQAAFEAAGELAPRSTTAKIGLARVLVQRRQTDTAMRLVDEALAIDPEATGARILKGEMLRMEKKLEPSLETFNAVLKSNPKQVEALLGRAAALIDLDRDQEAQANIDTALELAPKHPLGLYLNALILTKKQDYAGAKAVLDRAGASLDGYLPAQYLKGATAYAQGNLEQAAAYLGAFVQAVPDNANGRRLLGSTLIRQSRFDEAVKVFEPLLAGENADARVYSLVATAEMGAEDYEAAIAHFRKAISLDPKESLYRTQLAVARIAAGQSDDAVKDLQAAVTADPEAKRPQLLLIRFHLFNKEFDKALGIISRMLKEKPDDPVVLNLRGVTQRAQGKAPEARASFQAALTADPDYLPAAQNLSRMDMQSNNYDAAESRFAEVLKRDPKNEAAMVELARIALARGNRAKAVEWLEKAAAENPKSPVSGLRLIELYRESGDVVKALATASALERRLPDNPDVVEALGRTQLLAGDAVSAVATYNRLNEMAKNNPRVLYALGRAQYMSGDALGARASYEQALKLDPTLVPAVLELVNMETANGRYQNAMEIAAALRDGRPQMPIGDLLVGHVYVKMGKTGEAIQAFQAAERKINSADSALRLYYGYKSVKRPDAAFKALEDWLNKTPEDRQIRRVLASAYMEAGDMQKAIAHHQVLKQQDPGNPMILNNLAWLYQNVGDPRALDEAKRAYELAPDAAVVKDTYGWVLVEKGDVDRGSALLEEASALAPDEQEIQYHLALARAKQGKTEDACALLQTITESGLHFRQREAVRKLRIAQSCP
jgi:putative PEP-CTERM system TPR-repeat lipoprotein